jgi:ribosomal protein S1
MMILIVTMLSGCNKQIVDLTYSFDRAIISMPNGNIVEGEVQGWTDYEDGDQIQVKIDGKTYLVHSSQIVLIAE